jgi:glycosyltransferase involved in cell wall biosynthesis
MGSIKMIKILEVANFHRDRSPIDRNRRIISSFLDKEKFEVSAISGNEKIYALKKLLIQKFDIIHTRTWSICIPLSMIVKIRNRRNKHLLGIHGLPDNKHRYQAGKRLAKTANMVHSVSKVTAAQVKEAYGVNSVVIYNGIDTQRYKPIKHHNERTKIIFVGSYIERKKPQYVLQLAKKLPKYDFVMYGSHYHTSLFTNIWEQAKKLDNLSVNKSIPRDKLIEECQKSDIFLLPTLHEGFANVLLEATAVGLPVIAFNISSIPELIEHKKNGLLADIIFEKGTNKDLKSFNFSKIELSLDKISEHLQYLAEEKKIRKEMGKNAREKTEEFDWRTITKQYEKIYEKLYS